MRHFGRTMVSFNPWGPRRVIYRRGANPLDGTDYWMLAVGGWLQGRKGWPHGRWFRIERGPAWGGR